MNWTNWFRPADKPEPAQPHEVAPLRVPAIAGCESDFELAPALSRPHGLPLLDWDAVRRWLEPATDEAERAHCWGELERA